MEGLRIVFDLDGTLIDSAPDITEAVNLALGELALEPLSLKEVTSFIGNGLPVLAEHVRKARDVAEEQGAFVQRVRVHYDKISGTSGRMYPGAREALSALRAQGWRIGLCTNKPYDATLAVLAHHGLEEVFDAVLGGDSLAERKPDPAPLFAVLEGMGTGPAVYVGDSEVDAETARRAGLPFALFALGYRKASVEELDPAEVFEDYATLPEIARRLAS